MNRIPSIGLCAVLIAGLILGACGGSDSPSAPSATGKGVVLQGVLLSESAGSATSGQATALSASGRVVVTVQENPSITATVSANGTFALEGLPPGTFTLVFTRDGVNVGTITITGVGESVEIKIVVQLSSSGVVLIDISMNGDGDDSQDNNNNDNNPPGSSGGACVISGGRAGDKIELEGKVASGSASFFKLDVQGNRSSELVDVNASGASYRCVGKSGSDCKSTLKPGNQVHVRGTLTTCSTSAATVTATEVKVQK